MIKNLRKSFEVANKEALQWFPGHMTKGLRQMQQKLKTVDCVIEVHDARIPLSGRNPNFKYTVSGVKPHILVLNKKDLSESKYFSTVTEKIQQTEKIDHVIFTNCKDQRCNGVKKIIPLANDLISKSDRYNREDVEDNCIMVIGVPNVGKSSLINALRNRHLNRKGATAVGGVAGITRSVLNRIKISDEPMVYLLDTPGILTPSVPDNETGMKLALSACLPDHLVGQDLIADYLLYWMNRENNYKYVELMGLDNPTDNISEVLLAGSKKLNKWKKIKSFDGSLVIRPDLISSAQFMIKSFRTGDLGKLLLDRDRL